MQKTIMALAFLGVLSASPAFALDLTQPLKTYDGRDFVGNDGKPLGLTYGLAIENALLSAPPVGAKPEDQEADKKANYVLSEMINKHAKDFTPTPDDLIRIRKALVNTQVTAIFGRVMSFLDPTFLPKELQ